MATLSPLVPYEKIKEQNLPQLENQRRMSYTCQWRGCLSLEKFLATHFCFIFCYIACEDPSDDKRRGLVACPFGFIRKGRGTKIHEHKKFNAREKQCERRNEESWIVEWTEWPKCASRIEKANAKSRNGPWPWLRSLLIPYTRYRERII